MKITFVASFVATALSVSMALAQQQQQPATQAPASPPDLGLKVEVEPAAMAIVKAMADKLAAAKSMSFTALTTFESPDRTGLPLAYTTPVASHHAAPRQAQGDHAGRRAAHGVLLRRQDGAGLRAVDQAAGLGRRAQHDRCHAARGLPAGGDLLSLHRPRRQRSDEGDCREPARRLRRRQVDGGGRRSAPTSSSWSASSPTSSSGSAATTSCRAWRSRSSSRIRRATATPCSSRTGRSIRRWQAMPSPSQPLPARSAYRSRRRARRKRASEISGEHDEQEAASSRCNRHRNAARAGRRLVPCRRLERRRRSLVVVGA